MVAVEGGRPSDLAFDRLSARVGDRELVHDSGVEDRDGDVAYPFPTTCDCRAEYATYATFPLAAPTSVDDVAVRWDGPDGTTWSLPGAARSALSAPTTRFELVSFDAPGRVGSGESFEVGYEVRNAGDAPGTVRAVLNQEGPVYGVMDRHEESVAAGESVTRTTTVAPPPGSDVDEVKLRFRSVADDVDHAVAVDAETTEETATTGA